MSRSLCLLANYILGGGGGGGGETLAMGYPPTLGEHGDAGVVASDAVDQLPPVFCIDPSPFTLCHTLEACTVRYVNTCHHKSNKLILA